MKLLEGVAEPGLRLHSDEAIVPNTTLLEQEEKHRDKTTKQDHSKPSPEVQTSQPKQLQEKPWDIWSCSHQLDCTGQLAQCGQSSGIKHIQSLVSY